MIVTPWQPEIAADYEYAPGTLVCHECLFHAIEERDTERPLIDPVELFLDDLLTGCFS
jgi:hypothetical protein